MPAQGLDFSPLAPPSRVLLAPGPTNLPPEVIQALSAPLTGHKDPYFLHAMDETAQLLRFIYQTDNHTSMSLPGTGGAGMEAAIANLVEDGDPIVVCINGLFGMRMADIAARNGGVVRTVTAPWGKPVDASDVRKAAREIGAKVITVVHGETSTGVEQPLDDIGDVAREQDAMLIVDSVATLGGMPVEPDRWGSAICYSASQKCLSAPPGLSTVTISDEAMRRIRARREPVNSWYFDLDLHDRYWFAAERAYHHTAPVLLVYALHTALRLIAEEGLEERFARHALNHRAVAAGLEALGIELFADERYRLPTVISAQVPEGINDARVRAELLNEFGIEISGGLGDFAGKMWRVGIMGYSARREPITLFLSALETILARQGYGPGTDTALRAAEAVYAKAVDPTAAPA